MKSAQKCDPVAKSCSDQPHGSGGAGGIAEVSWLPRCPYGDCCPPPQTAPLIARLLDCPRISMMRVKPGIDFGQEGTPPRSRPAIRPRAEGLIMEISVRVVRRMPRLANVRRVREKVSGLVPIICAISLLRMGRSILV